MKEKYKQIFSWTMVIMWMGLIFFLSAQVATESDSLSLGLTEGLMRIIEKISPGMDVGSILSNHVVRKLAHFFAYLILGVLVLNALTKSGYTRTSIGAMALAICVLYAVSDEVHQLFVPGRSGQVKDVLIDSVGAMVGIGLSTLYKSIVKGVSKASS